ncbi:FAD-dependent oxidoreductase [Pseudoduganella sp. FT25W]|uniref:FAD-dependent oxidoreductase n=1 Tax=Duganella alba TaxID=2666081 RepID=A0A6L5QH26_9BURK|nr:NAD(P)-binding protein [Duganella alba]MRX09123.1 FAD-dependent oxidoreductase [Duganella alba]MRX15600.1 FAD-dependent oxidoreductase [Duganella alba]
MATRPSYIYQGGSVMMHSPLQLKNSEMYGFFVKGDLAKLQSTLDGTLNAVAGQRMTFKAISPYVLITFTQVNHADSAAPVDHAKGWITEIDIVTWIMVGAMDDDGKLAHIYYYPAHIFVDDAMALINGRELFGYPKYLCEYEIDAQRCALSAKGFHPFSPETKIAMHPLLEVTATRQTDGEKEVSSLLELIEQAIELFLSIPDFFNMDVAGWEDIISLLRNPRIDQIFLKQFPDSAGLKAVYQAILAAPATIEKIHSGKVLGYEYQAVLHAFDSFPLNETLGLQLGAQQAILPYYLNFDFTAQPGEELVDNSSIAPQKVAILGGGVSAMTTAYYLTEQPGWQNNYDITVYQQGWRLGGKGASGRNAQYGQRIEEHGLHIWFGFYSNAFKMIKAAYASLERPPGAPLATWRDAFKQQDYVALSESVGGQWRNWSIVFPTLPGEPGEGDQKITLWQMAVAMVGWIEQWIRSLDNLTREMELPPHPHHTGVIPDWLYHLAEGVTSSAHELLDDVSLLAGALSGMVFNMAEDASEGQHLALAGAMAGVRGKLHARYGKLIANADGDVVDDIRRLFICLDLGITVMKGVFEDGVIRHGFDVINDIDFRDWLRKHGGDEQLCVQSAPVRGFYDLIFAYEGGAFDKPNAEAGTMLRAMARIGLAYKGGIMFKMQAGMGDTIFTPMYQALLNRGVKFQFFHKVEELVPDGAQIGSIRMTQQVQLAGDAYDPLVPVKGLDCWPSEPLYGQIDPAQAALLQEQGINLESHWTDWPQVYRDAFGKELPAVTLKRGVDFDQVVFGISIGSLPVLCPQLLAQSPALLATSEKVQTVATQAYQVWLDRDLAQMGWANQPKGPQPVLSGFTEPFDTWAPMDQLLVREDWPAPLDPRNVSYFCSALPVESYPPVSDHGFPQRMAQVAKEGAIHQLSKEIASLWSAAGPAGAFPWQWLVDGSEATGVQRFDAQYWRANVDPSERYVMSVVNSTRYRLRTDQSGFSNLFLTGDWIKTGINAGCVEAAVMAGMQTSRAISGYPVVIEGETDF